MVKMPIFPKLVNRFNATSIYILARFFFVEIKVMLTFIQKCKGTRRAKNNFENPEKMGGLGLDDLEIYCIVTAINTGRYCRRADGDSGGTEQRIPQHPRDVPDGSRVREQMKGEERAFPQWCGAIGHPQAEKKEPRPKTRSLNKNQCKMDHGCKM